ncbi:putative Na+/H+ antiporter [Azospira sp. APE16]|uniref:Na+/H+ antiporter n=1 Tax=Azospira oryzae (strain ATCC BAA-33 / DSM 13638 / PS) TaxID=640081 RepID=G8QKH6_AZOOP|nr:putative Na+/H+ antiporter [Azospira oryzae]AEV27715.1 Protein of unknown function (DUF1504) [Azospira oryzae PS]
MSALAPTPVEIAATLLFAVAILHTFSTKYFEHLAHTQPAHAGLWHLLGEVEVVFGFWAMVLVLVMVGLQGTGEAVAYLESCNYTEALFVFVIMVIAASRPILALAGHSVRAAARLLPLPDSVATFFVILFLVPLLGSFITEPAAMTLGALLLRDRYFARPVSSRLKYATLAVLFVNISIGGTLTPFAAPPVLMVAGKWGWDLAFMASTFGWKAAIAVGINALVVTFVYRRELVSLCGAVEGEAAPAVPAGMVLVHLAFLVGVVVFAHHPAVFLGLFLFFLGFCEAYKHHQDRLILREGLLVAFFLAGLVTLGGLQKWWLQDVLAGMAPTVLFFGATALTALTDNAALTYLGSLVEGVTPAFQYALVAGAVTGGGLTVIANAPNPAGFSILKGTFHEQAISPIGLLLCALPPTLVSVLAFQLL